MNFDFFRRLMVGKPGGKFDQLNKKILETSRTETNAKKLAIRTLKDLEKRLNKHFCTRGKVTSYANNIHDSERVPPIHIVTSVDGLDDFGLHKSIELDIYFNFSSTVHYESFTVTYKNSSIFLTFAGVETKDINEFCQAIEAVVTEKYK